MYLKNGWTVHAIDWSSFPPNNPILSTVNYSAHPGTTNPAVFVNCWIRMFIASGGLAEYSFRIDIYGPQGTEYF
jgi:hypothetical protein